MNHLGAFFRILLGLFVGFLSLLAFSQAPSAVAYRDFAFFGGGGVAVFLSLFFGGGLSWIAYKLIAGTFCNQRTTLS
ncbi:hypothetical protein [Aureliella helgolandensis]|uniref:Uncharacterized protein n=1 Tax=Aureliella helgolandensis TaxID=2527968 RepID=A0A518GG59_9BACT|nr:hypothetical protein [Aureliella helgolandensis]QDV27579.1 hypothetical protein Q31a_59710 [Aureliella helgolandensis]